MTVPMGVDLVVKQRKPELKTPFWDFWGCWDSQVPSIQLTGTLSKISGFGILEKKRYFFVIPSIQDSFVHPEISGFLGISRDSSVPKKS
jgi:hypothetical protein